MYKLQYSVRTLLACVLLLAIAFEALSSESDLWTTTITTLTVLVLLAAALGAIVRRGGDRACWIGFALFAWAHFAIVTVPVLHDRLGVWLWTTQSIGWFQVFQQQQSTTRSAIPPGAVLIERQLSVSGTDWVRLSDFVPTGQSGGASSAVKTITVSDPRVLKATVRPGDPEMIDLAAGRRPGGTDVVTADALGRQFVFRIVVYVNPQVTQKTWDCLMTVLAGLIGVVIAFFLGRGSKKENQPNETGSHRS